MWFVTLVLLIVAAYFVWEAIRDFKFFNSGNSLSTARRESVTSAAGAHGTRPGAIHKNTHTAADRSEGAPAGVRSGSESAAQHQLTGRTSTGSGTAKVGAATAAMGATAVAAAVNQASRTDSGRLKYLDAPDGPKDALSSIDGIGPVVESELNDIGIYHYRQIANFKQSDIDNVNAELEFPGRIERERWVDQAQRLMASSATAHASGRAGSAAAEVAAAAGSRPAASMNDTTRLTDADLTGAWNTDVLIEVQERLKVLNTRESDAPRLQMSKPEYKAIKEGDETVFSRERLLEILERLRFLGE